MDKKFTNETEFVVINNANASFTTVMNYIFDDKNISFKAQGIYCQIIRYQNSATHKLYISSLVKQKTDGKAAIAAGIKELIEHGYITKENIRNEKGQIKGVRYQVFTMPLTENRLSEIGKPEISLSEIGKSDTYNKNTDINKINKKENKKNTPKGDADTVTYGEFKNVFLTGEEYSKLINRYNEKDVLRNIEAMSRYIDSSGKKYKKYYSALLGFLARDNKAIELPKIEVHQQTEVQKIEIDTEPNRNRCCIEQDWV